ncbi:MAG: AAA family ATPase [Acidobacteria bacterium]|nr:AAA family ATPase [Acidobacteriota bacterium]MYI40133.1 AAA family ATPase [Acidobacteriota bacterium]
MRISQLTVENIRGINLAVLDQLGDVVAIAGANGCGKSCLLDCVRLFKSQYGSYYANEQKLWWQEKSLSLDDRASAIQVLRQKNRNGRIVASIKLEDTEKEFILKDTQRLTERLALLEMFPTLRPHYAEGLWNWRSVPELVRYERQVQEYTTTMRADIRSELARDEIQGEVTIHRNGTLRIRPNRALTYIFSTFEPDHLGVIDFHAADRSYTYEQVSNVNIRFSQKDDIWKNSAMYNLAQKYGNVKSALATEYIRNIIAEKAGGRQGAAAELTTTLRSIFHELIPGKQFDGPTPTPTGELEFPVRTAGTSHDLNELSSGEKEIVFGYLRTRARAARNSVIIVDEPELHLNPAMIRGLPALYQAHIGSALNNQIWLVTHSDVFLRTAFYDSDMELFHMAVGVREPGRNQITRISQTSEFDRACIELIGDIANYRPDQPVLIVEGQQQFDILVLRRLFADSLKGVNVLEAGGKSQVQQRQKSLQKSARQSGQTKTVLSITDSDGDEVSDEGRGQYQWPAYHIENYLLEPKYIGLAIDSITAKRPGTTSLHYVGQLLQTSKKEAASEIGRRRLVRSLKSRLNRHLQLSPGKTGEDLTARDLRRQLESSRSAIDAEFDAAMEGDTLERNLESQRQESEMLQEQEATPDTLPGRDVLRRIALSATPNGNYETLRNTILNEMARDGFQPPAMKSVLERCLGVAAAS